MDVLPRITRQLVDRFREMSHARRATSIALLFAVLLGFGWLVFFNDRTDFQAVSFGKVFSADEFASAERALVTAGLTGFRRDGQRLMAPYKELDRYNAALLEFDALPTDLGSQMLKHYETLGPFSTDRQRQQMKEALLLQELRRMIKAVPDIEDARVAVASSERKIGWNQKPRATANVTVKPRAGREISTTLVNSLRQVVASMVPDLQPADVTVFDVTRGQAYSGEPIDDASDRRYLQRAQEFTRQYEQQIQKALSHIPHVGVVVHVDLDALKSSVVGSETDRSQLETAGVATRPATIDVRDLHSADSHRTGFRGPGDRPTETTRAVTEQSFIANIPKAVHVSVSIPRDYLRDKAKRRVVKGEMSPDRLDASVIEEDVLTEVERIVGRLIPAASPSNAISVTYVDLLGVDARNEKPPSAHEPLAVLVRRWGGWMAIGVFALVSLWILRRSTPVASLVNDGSDIREYEHVPAAMSSPAETSVRAPVAAPDCMVMLRAEIRSLVASDPAGSAELLGQWISEAQTAILLLSLDQGLAADVLGRLPRENVERVTLAIASAEHITREQQESVLNDFKAAFVSRPLMQPSGPEAARELLERTLERNDVEPIQQRIEEQIRAGPFAFLHNRHSDDVRTLISDEHPQTIALIAAQLPPNLAAEVLASFEAAEQAEILGRLARLGPTDADVLAEIASLLQDRIGRIPVRAGGVARAVDVLRETTRAASRALLQTLDEQDSNLAGTLRESLFSFQDVARLDDAMFRVVLQATDDCQWAVALKGSSETLRQRVFSSLSANLAHALKDEMNSVGPLRLSEITAVQHQIAEAILALEADGRLDLPKTETKRPKPRFASRRGIV